MNVIREINRINERELELGGDGTKASWHDDYKDSAYVFVGGLPFELTEGDVITIMSQFGEVADINMPRDKETGKPKGFAFVMYEDQRSTVLAVDNLTGGQVLGRTIRVDHVKDYKQPGTRNDEGDFQEPEQPSMNALPPIIDDSERSTSSSDAAEEDEDPMAAYIRAERKKQKSSSSKRKKEKGGEAERESKEARRARKAAKKAKKAEKKASGSRVRDRDAEEKPRVKRERDGSRHGDDDDDDRKPRIREVSRRTRSRSRSPLRRQPFKPDPSEEDIKPSLGDLSPYSGERRRDDERRRRHPRSVTPPSARDAAEHEVHSPNQEEDTRYARREDVYPDRYEHRDRDNYPSRDYQPRDRSPHHAHRDAPPRSNGPSDRAFGSRDRDRDHPPARSRTDEDWRSARHQEPPAGDRASETDYASWRGKRDVERVMRRVGGRDEGREKRW